MESQEELSEIGVDVILQRKKLLRICRSLRREGVPRVLLEKGKAAIEKKERTKGVGYREHEPYAYGRRWAQHDRPTPQPSKQTSEVAKCEEVTDGATIPMARTYLRMLAESQQEAAIAKQHLWDLR